MFQKVKVRPRSRIDGAIVTSPQPHDQLVTNPSSLEQTNSRREPAQSSVPANERTLSIAISGVHAEGTGGEVNAKTRRCTIERRWVTGPRRVPERLEGKRVGRRDACADIEGSGKVKGNFEVKARRTRRGSGFTGKITSPPSSLLISQT